MCLGRFDFSAGEAEARHRARSRALYYEAAELAREIDPRWNHASPELMTLYRKAREFESGVRVDFEGRKYPPLYTPRNDTLIGTFRITDAEQRLLSTIISPSLAAERHRLRDEARRREAGEVERQTYLARAKTKQESARALQAQGKSTQEIADHLKCSKRAVNRYLKRV